jgi:hypothetical protein
MTKLDYIN